MFEIPEELNDNVIVDAKNTWFDGEHGGVFAYSLSGHMLQVDIAREDSLRRWWDEFLTEVKNGASRTNEELKALLEPEEIWDEDPDTGVPFCDGYTEDSVWRSHVAKTLLIKRGVDVN